MLLFFVVNILSHLVNIIPFVQHSKTFSLFSSNISFYSYDVSNVSYIIYIYPICSFLLFDINLAKNIKSFNPISLLKTC